MDFNPIPYNLSGGFESWLQLVGVLAGVAIVLGLIGSFLNGIGIGGFASGLMNFVKEIVTMSPRRIWALTMLTLKECIRRKALLVFVVFAALLMFGGWFLPQSSERAEMEVGSHIAFVLTTISWLILPVVIFLSCWGIPEDIRIRSLHTVVTKPARRAEIVLGRMLGFGTMAVTILLIMGAFGYVWILRQVPADLDSTAKANLLKCRVPVYGGQFYFLDRQGLPSQTGLNVGDTWKHRSFVEGNSQSRAVWTFGRIRPQTMGDTLRLESRFEAFRTVKGSEDSIQSGLEAQYTLIRDARDEAFSTFGVGASFRDAATALQDGNFKIASELLTEIAERLSASPEDFSPIECQQVAMASVRQAAPAIRSVGEEFEDVAQAFHDFGMSAAAVRDQSETASRVAMSIPCSTLADVLAEQATDMLEAMPRIEVPLEPFRISEFHEGDDYQAFPSDLSYPGNSESIARFLARLVSDLNEQGSVVSGDELSSDLVDTLVDDGNIDTLNAERVLEVLQEEIDDGNLVAANGTLTIADDRRWLEVFNELVSEERLISMVPEGWVLNANIFEDLAPNGFLRIEVACLDDQMYLGMSRSDLFIRLHDNPFWMGYGKALLNIGLMLCLIIVLGVTASCVVKGPVSFFFTLTVFVIGQFFHTFMTRILSGQEEGSGMIESAMLMLQHRNPSTGVDTSDSSLQIIEAADKANLGLLQVASNIIPDFSNFTSAAAYIENGFDVPWNSSVLPAIATFVGFFVPCVILGAAFLKFRELESK